MKTQLFALLVLCLLAAVSAVAQTSTANGAGVLALNSGAFNTGEGCTALYTNSSGTGSTPVGGALLTVNYLAAKPGGGSWLAFSDSRLKTLGGGFNSGLSEILKINPVRYRYKEDNAMGIRDTDEHVGLIAEEVQNVIPEAVTENSKGYLLLNNDPIIWAMLNAIKEQQTTIQGQQERIAQLTSQVRAIGASMSTNGESDSEVRTLAMVPVFLVLVLVSVVFGFCCLRYRPIVNFRRSA